MTAVRFNLRLSQDFSFSLTYIIHEFVDCPERDDPNVERGPGELVSEHELRHHVKGLILPQDGEGGAGVHAGEAEHIVEEGANVVQIDIWNGLEDCSCGHRTRQ